MEWWHTHCLYLKCESQTISIRKIMATVLLVDSMSRWATINSDTYCMTLKKLHTIKNKQYSLLSSGVFLLHNTNQIFWWGSIWPLMLQSRSCTQWLPPVPVRKVVHWWTVFQRQYSENCSNGMVVLTGSRLLWSGHAELVECYDKCINKLGNYVDSGKK